jgi:hypothetical protein
MALLLVGDLDDKVEVQQQKNIFGVMRRNLDAARLRWTLVYHLESSAHVPLLHPRVTGFFRLPQPWPIECEKVVSVGARR